MQTTKFPPCPRQESLASMIGNSICHRSTGTVHAILGQRIEVRGLNAPVGSICTITTEAGRTGTAKVIGFQEDHPILSTLVEVSGISVGDRVQLTSDTLAVKVGPKLLGRIVDALGRPLDDRPLPDSLLPFPAEPLPPSSLSRPPIDTVFQTGVRSIDAFLTCGVGQRLGIFAGPGVGKSTLLGMLARYTQADAIVIGLIGERGREVREFIEDVLGPTGMQRSAVVVSTNDQPAAMRIQAAWTATAIASSLREQGKNVVLLLDSITRFATAQRELGLAAGEPPTTRGYPPSVFAQLPKLVEQAGRTDTGSITAFYSVLVDGDDTNEPISDALRGLLDGHILLSRKIASEGLWPAIDVLESLSRLQTRILPEQVLQDCQKVRESLALYRSHEELINIGAYKPGTQVALDQAIELQPQVRQFLAQRPTEAAPYASTLQQLKALSQ